MPKLAELARLIDAELIGDNDAVVIRARPFEFASEGDVTLALDSVYVSRVGESRATAVIVSGPISGSSRNLLVAHNPKLAFARAIEALHRVGYEAIGVSEDLIVGSGTKLGGDLSIHPRVTIGRDSSIGDRVTLHPGVVIGDRCSVGEDAIVHPNVTVYRECTIGDRVIIHAGAVIGADGFGFVPDTAGHQVKLLQLGRVVIEDDCEIGANCTIDRGGFGDTVLRRGVKLDNLRSVFNEYTVEFTYGKTANIFEFQLLEDLPSYVTLIANVAFDSSLQMAQTSARGQSAGAHIVLNVNEFDVDLKIRQSKTMEASILGQVLERGTSTLIEKLEVELMRESIPVMATRGDQNGVFKFNHVPIGPLNVLATMPQRLMRIFGAFAI